MMIAFTPSARQASLSEHWSEPLLGLLLHLLSRAVSALAVSHPRHKNSHSSHFQSKQSVQVTHRWLEEPNKWDTQVNKWEHKQSPREECFFSPFSQQFPYHWIIIFNGSDFIHNMKPYTNRRRNSCRKTILGHLIEMKKWPACWIQIYLLVFTPLNWVTTLLIHK